MGPEKEDFVKIIKMEEMHVNFWIDFLKKRGFNANTIRPNRFYLELYKILIKLIGHSLALQIFMFYERQAIESYSEMMSDSRVEVSKATLEKVLEDELVHEEYFINMGNKYGGFITYIKDAVLE